MLAHHLFFQGYALLFLLKELFLLINFGHGHLVRLGRGCGSGLLRSFEESFAQLASLGNHIVHRVLNSFGFLEALCAQHLLDQGLTGVSGLRDRLLVLPRLDLPQHALGVLDPQLLSGFLELVLIARIRVHVLHE